MTEHDAKGLEIIAGWLERDGLLEPATMLRRLAAGASSGTDEFKEAYQEGHFQGYSEGIEAGRREYSASISASIAALRERIAGMERLVDSVKVVHKKMRFEYDEGPRDEGWQSVELSSAWGVIEEAIAKEKQQ